MKKWQKNLLAVGILVFVVAYRNMPEHWHLIPLVIASALIGVAFGFIPEKAKD